MEVATLLRHQIQDALAVQIVSEKSSSPHFLPVHHIVQLLHVLDVDLDLWKVGEERDAASQRGHLRSGLDGEQSRSFLLVFVHLEGLLEVLVHLIDVGLDAHLESDGVGWERVFLGALLLPK